jgi:hypothetical protein
MKSLVLGDLRRKLKQITQKMSLENYHQAHTIFLSKHPIMMEFLQESFIN